MSNKNAQFNPMLRSQYSAENKFEIGLDESGRGPIYGRVYVGAVICPKDIPTCVAASTRKTKKNPELVINWANIKDSKKIKKHETMRLCSDFIKANSVAWSVNYVEAKRIDEINIRQAVFEAMHKCISELIDKMGSADQMFLLVDGNDFKPFPVYIESEDRMHSMPFETVVGGDNTYLSIAAASILAKCARDDYILDLCEKNPELTEKYGMNTNMGYGTKKHYDGIAKYGIMDGHRLSFIHTSEKSDISQVIDSSSSSSSS